MWFSVYLVFGICAVRAHTLNLTFPLNFIFGVASGSYQGEGAWNYSDKGESVWDRYFHTHPEMVTDHSTGDVTCDSYHKYKEDVKLVAKLGVHFYKFSISWSRILPTGFANYISEDGTRYYKNLIDELIKHGVEPIITMYHSDLPQPLQDLGGWTNPQVVDWFAEYARVLYTHYGNRVKTWITINEPIMLCDLLYGLNLVDLGPSDKDHASLLCSKHAMLAHAKAWRTYDKEFRPKFHGKMSITNLIFWIEGRTEQDQELADIITEYSSGRYSHPIFSKHGGWPPKLEAVIKKHSTAAGYNTSRLPSFTPEEINFIRGTFDFYSVNYYSGRVVFPAEKGKVLAPFPLGDVPEFTASLGVRPHWKYGASKSLPIHPSGLRKTLNWINDTYGPIEILITENGYSNVGRHLKDEDRIQFIRDHLEQVLLSVHEDRLNVTGYTYWSLLDNFEWLDGYTVKFGLYEVDFSSPERTRTPRSSARYYADTIKQRTLLAAPLNSANDNNNFRIFSLTLSFIFVVLYSYILKNIE